MLLVAFAGGFFLGLLVAFAYRTLEGKNAQQVAEALFKVSEKERREDIEAVISKVKESFGNLSLSALSRSTEEFLKLAKTKLDAERDLAAQELDAKKGLIDQDLVRMTGELEQVATLVRDLEKDRTEKFGELTSQLRTTGEQTAALVAVTSTLREALGSTRARGQWGERMAGDVLRLAGFIENVNFLKEKTIEASGSRPDFTFPLPQGRKLHMDVKFPGDNYWRFLEAASELEKEKYCKEFLRNVRSRIKEVTSREYINPDEGTLDYVLLFIPNEQIYAFIHERDSSILDEAIRHKVVLCSPFTLFAVLAVIREAVENFSLEKTSNEILALLGAFKRQWDEFREKLELVGKRLEEAQREYEALATTRWRQLERPLVKLEALRAQRDVLAAELPAEEDTISISVESKDAETEP